MAPTAKKNHTLAEFCTALKAHDRYLLACHVNPEGDTIGSILAIDSLLRRLGKKTTIVCEDEFPERLDFLSTKRWHRVRDISPKASFQALVTADCPNLKRIGAVNRLLKPGTLIFNLDHHISSAYFGNFNYVRPEAAACGEVVFDIFKYFKLPLTKEEAVNLYVALATDTGSFKYSNTSVHSHRIAAELIVTGIDIEKINEKIHSTHSLNKMNLYSRLLRKVKTSPNGEIAWVGMTREDLKKSSATEEDTEGFIDFLKYLREVKVVFFMSELAHRKCVRVSFRSKAPYDVNKIASCFNGGGHRQASGCIIEKSLIEAEKKILVCIKKEFRSL